MIHTVHNDFLTVAVAEDGAQLQSILGRDGTEYLWQGDPAYWPDRALNLFPYVARLTEGSYYLDGRLHRMEIHGIAPYRRFRLAEQRDDALVLELAADRETMAQYPRDFRFRIHYVLRDSVLEVVFEVENRDEKPMYFGLGGHPGFRVPLVPGKTFEDYRLRFAEPCQPRRVGFTPACFLSGVDTDYPLEDGRLLPLRHTLFDDDAVVLRDVSRQVTLETDGDSHAVTVTFPQMPYLGIWHMPRTDAPYVCLEPWCSLPSAQDRIAVLEEQADLISLAPGAAYRNQWTIAIHQPAGEEHRE